MDEPRTILEPVHAQAARIAERATAKSDGVAAGGLEIRLPDDGDRRGARVVVVQIHEEAARPRLEDERV